MNTARPANRLHREQDPGNHPSRPFSHVHLSIGCQLDLRCESATPLLALVHPHISLVPDLVGAERLELEPERGYELLTDQSGNRWCRLLARAGTIQLRYAATIHRPDSNDPVLPAVGACPIEALPIDTYRFLNPSTYCDTPALMELAWSTFAGMPPGWSLVQAICDWVHGRIRFDYDAIHPHKRASDAADVPFLRSFGAHQLCGFTVITEAIAQPSSSEAQTLQVKPPLVKAATAS